MGKKTAQNDEHKELQELCDLISLCKQLQMSDTEIAHELIKRYGYCMHQLTYDEYIAWIRSNRRFAQIYFTVISEVAQAELINAGDCIKLL